MKKKKTRHISLRTKAFRIILTGALLLILMISAVGLGGFSFLALKDYHEEAEHLMGYTESLLDMEYVEKFYGETKEIYDGLPDEVRRDPYSEEFLEAFRPLLDDDFYAAREVLVNCRVESENRNVALIMTDPELSAIVYVIDGDEIGWAYAPGQWIKTDLTVIDRIVRSSWKLMMTNESEYGWMGTDYRELKASDGSRLGYISIDMDMNDFFRRIFHTLLILVPAAIAVILFVAYQAARLTEKHILSHLGKLAEAAREYTARDKVDDPSGDAPSFFSPLGIRTSDELEELWQSMSDMETDMNDTMCRLRTVTAEQERMEAELMIATQIQEGTLPRQFPAFPDRTEFEIYASMTPAKEVGGDFYDFFLVDEDHLAMVIADVSGKGISAALFMVNAKALLQNQTMQSGTDVVEVCEKVNRRLIEQNEAMLFVTVWLGVLTIPTGEVTYVNAGHEYPAIYRNGSRFTIEKDIHSGPMAAFEGMRFRAGSFVLRPGDTVFCYTDGVTEANNSDQELFGTERLLEALNRQPDALPEELDGSIRQAITDFAGGEPQFDDTTILTVKYFGSTGVTGGAAE